MTTPYKKNETKVESVNELLSNIAGAEKLIDQLLIKHQIRKQFLQNIRMVLSGHVTRGDKNRLHDQVRDGIITPLDRDNFVNRTESAELWPDDLVRLEGLIVAVRKEKG